jgi:hypothetical protein
MSQIIRSRNLSLAGLTQEDYDNRSVVAIGWMHGELLPPYPNATRREKAENILAYLAGKRFRRSCSSLHIPDIKRKFRKDRPKLVEVVGGVGDGCLFVSAHYLLIENIPVLIHPSRIFLSSRAGKFPDFWIGKIMLRDLLWKEERKCLIYGEDLIFYTVT